MRTPEENNLVPARVAMHRGQTVRAAPRRGKPDNRNPAQRLAQPLGARDTEGARCAS